MERTALMRKIGVIVSLLGMSMAHAAGDFDIEDGVLNKYTGAGGDVVNVPEGVVEIGAGAFGGVQTLGKVVLPEGVEVIGTGAFEGSSLTEIVLPGSVREIHEKALGSENLKTVHVGWAHPGYGIIVSPTIDAEGMPEIFADGANLGEMTLKLGNANAETAWYEETEPWNGFGTIERETAWATPETELVERDGIYYFVYRNSGFAAVTNGHRYGKKGYYYLEKDIQNVEGVYEGDIIIPETVEVGGRTFEVWVIERYAFLNSTPRSITLPRTLREVGALGLGGHEAMETRGGTLKFAKGSVITLRQMAFKGVNQTLVDMGGVSLTYGALTSSCMENSKVEAIVWPDDLETIGWGAFHNSALKMADVPEGVKKIDRSAFSECKALERVSLQIEDLQQVGDLAFYGTENLTEIHVYGNTPASVTYGENIFDEETYKRAKLILHGGAVSVYQAVSVWAPFLMEVSDESPRAVEDSPVEVKAQVASDGSRGLTWEWVRGMELRGTQQAVTGMAVSDDEKIVIGIRHNGGGRIDDAVDVAANGVATTLLGYDAAGNRLWETTLEGENETAKSIVATPLRVVDGVLYCEAKMDRNKKPVAKFKCGGTSMDTETRYDARGDTGKMLVKIDMETGAYIDNICMDENAGLTVDEDGNIYVIAEEIHGFGGLMPGRIGTDKDFINSGVYVVKLDKDFRVSGDFVLDVGVWSNSIFEGHAIANVRLDGGALAFDLSKYRRANLWNLPLTFETLDPQGEVPLKLADKVYQVALWYDFGQDGTAKLKKWTTSPEVAKGDAWPHYTEANGSLIEQDRDGAYGIDGGAKTDLPDGLKSTWKFARGRVTWDSAWNIIGYADGMQGKKWNSDLGLPAEATPEKAFGVEAQVVKYTADGAFGVALQVPVSANPKDQIIDVAACDKTGAIYVAVEFMSHIGEAAAAVDWNPEPGQTAVIRQGSLPKFGIVKYVETLGITAETEGSGTVGIGETVVKFGGETTITIAPEKGWHLDESSLKATAGTLVDNGNGQYTLVGIDAPCVVRAVFVQDDDNDNGIRDVIGETDGTTRVYDLLGREIGRETESRKGVMLVKGVGGVRKIVR